MSTLPIQTQPFSLAGSGAAIGATSIIIKSLKGIDGALLAMADLGTKGYMTLEPNNGSQEEQISFTGITQNADGTATITGVSSVDFKSPYTETSGVLTSHPGGSVAVLSNTSAFYSGYTNAANDVDITGIWTTIDPTTPTQIANKEYVDSVVASGAADASTSVKGIVQIPTQAQVDARTSNGSTSAYLGVTPNRLRSVLISDYVADTGAADAYAIAPTVTVTAYAAGQTFTFKANNNNTGAACTLDVNALGAKNIVKNGGYSLSANDIVAGQIINVTYDGTQFQMNVPVANLPLSTSVLKFGGTGADGSLSISSGTTTIDLAGARYVVKNYVNLNITGTGALSFINPHAEGSYVILKCSGSTTFSSSAAPMLSVAGLGASYGYPGVSTLFTKSNYGVDGAYSTPGTGGIKPDASSDMVSVLTALKGIPLGVGSPGGKGYNNAGSAGRGGGGLYLEIAGSFNFSTTNGISVAGTDGGNGNATSGGNGGGSGGMFMCLYGTIAVVTGTVNVKGGNGGTGQGSTGGTGGSGTGSNGNGGDGGSGAHGGAGQGDGGGGGGFFLNTTPGGGGGAGTTGGGGGGASGFSFIAKNVNFV